MWTTLALPPHLTKRRGLCPLKLA